MVQTVIGEWNVTTYVDQPPATYDWYVENAILAEEFDLKSPDGRYYFVGVGTFDASVREHWKPLLIVAQRYFPEYVAGFEPGLLIVPETGCLFVGAGERLLAYDLRKPARLWEDHADCGFQGWGRCGNYVWMAAELEFAVWRLDGTKLWTTFVDPPWNPSFSDGLVMLDASDKKRTMRMTDGAEVA